MTRYQNTRVILFFVHSLTFPPLPPSSHEYQLLLPVMGLAYLGRSGEEEEPTLVLQLQTLAQTVEGKPLLWVELISLGYSQQGNTQFSSQSISPIIRNCSKRPREHNSYQ
jgi:hypothetical protein